MPVHWLCPRGSYSRPLRHINERKPRFDQAAEGLGCDEAGYQNHSSFATKEGLESEDFERDLISEEGDRKVESKTLSIAGLRRWMHDEIYGSDFCWSQHISAHPMS